MESEITYNKAGDAVSFSGDAVHLFRARTLWSSLKMYHKAKIIPTRGVGVKRMLALTTEYTGKTYTPRKIEQAIDDLDQWCHAFKASLPEKTV